MAAHGSDVEAHLDFDSGNGGNYPTLTLKVSEETSIRPGERTGAQSAAVTSKASFESWLAAQMDAWGSARWTWYQGLTVWQKASIHTIVKNTVPVVTPTP